MCIITATELKENLGKYLKMASKEEILVTKNGKPLIRLCSAKSTSWDGFCDEFGGIAKESNLDLNDPKIAGILGKL